MKQTKATLSALDSILAEMTDNKIRDDEFTSVMAYEKHTAEGGTMTIEAIRHRLNRMVADGRLQVRKVSGKTGKTLAYSVKP